MRKLAVLLVFCIVYAGHVLAEPWAAPGDVRLRHDLQLLSDSGLLNIPLTTWPISWGDVSHALDTPSSDLDASVMAAYRRVEDRLQAENEHRIKLKARLSAAGTPIRFRSFADTSREKAEAELGIEWMNDTLAVKLQGEVVRDPRDGRRYRPDGSYAGLSLGNWMLSAGWMDRWWGPGWEGSLIMSNNARPIPAVGIQRNFSDPFDFPVLSWLGPWNFRFFTGQLEGDRVIPHASLSGMRLSFKPIPSMEIGLSRTAIWGGDGQPKDMNTLVKVLFGIGINNGPSPPGDSLGGYDLRWVSPLFDLPYAIYTQWIGEDVKGYTPKRFLQQAGVETWGALGDSGISYRLRMEYSNTTVNFWRNHPKYNIAYVHGTYRSGYRYNSESLGHAVDGDGQMLSLGGVLVEPEGRTWELILRSIRTNQDGVSPGPVKIPAEQILAAEGRVTFETGFGEFQLGANLYRSRINAASRVSYQGSVEAEWKVQL